MRQEGRFSFRNDVDKRLVVANEAGRPLLPKVKYSLLLDKRLKAVRELVLAVPCRHMVYYSRVAYLHRILQLLTRPPRLHTPLSQRFRPYYLVLQDGVQFWHFDGIWVRHAWHEGGGGRPLGEGFRWDGWVTFSVGDGYESEEGDENCCELTDGA